MKKLLITGPESSGKTFLANEISKILDGELVKEYAREFLSEQIGYKEKDLTHIAKQQSLQEFEAFNSATNLVVCDTGIEVICIWSQEKFGKVASKIQNLLNLEKYDLILLCKPNIPWEADELREHPYQRDYLFDIYVKFLEYYKVSYFVIDEDLNKRTQQALAYVSNIK
ncbi:MAG: AAA family ATPase [Salibacteraceae bacterium]